MASGWGLWEWALGCRGPLSKEGKPGVRVPTELPSTPSIQKLPKGQGGTRLSQTFGYSLGDFGLDAKPPLGLWFLKLSSGSLGPHCLPFDHPSVEHTPTCPGHLSLSLP